MSHRLLRLRLVICGLIQLSVKRPWEALLSEVKSRCLPGLLAFQHQQQQLLRHLDPEDLVAERYHRRRLLVFQQDWIRLT